MSQSSNAWAAIYGEEGDNMPPQTTTATHSHNTLKDNRALSDRPPWATDDNETQTGLLDFAQGSQVTSSDRTPHHPDSHAKLDRALPAQRLGALRGTDTASLMRDTDDQIQSPSKRRKTDAHLLAQAKETGSQPIFQDEKQETDLARDDEQTWTALAQLAESALKKACTPSESAAATDVDSETALEDEVNTDFLFRNDIQRCEAFIATLKACVDLCNYKGSDEMAAFLATTLEKAVDAININPSKPGTQV